MTALDYVILAVLACGFITGFIKGVIQQAFSLGGLVLGIILGTLLYKPFAGLLQGFLSMSDKTACIVAFVIILLVVPMLCGLVGKLLSKLVHAASLGFLDRLLGALFGLFKYLIIMGLVIKVLDMTGISDKMMDRDEKKQSKYYEPVSEFTGFCLQWTWNKVQESAGDFIPEMPDFRKNPDKEKKDETKV
ncbi:MAG: CvpA family protein [Bacteroidaceae bacterium]